MIHKTSISVKPMFAFFTDTCENEDYQSKLSFRRGRNRAGVRRLRKRKM